MLSKFPSPYGVTVIKSRDKLEHELFHAEFPSPYGVTVIKSDAVMLMKETDEFVSVPLRGNGN